MSENKTLRAALAVLVLLFLPTSARALNVVTNPVTNNSEATWSYKPAGQSYSDVLYSYLDGPTWAPSVTLSHGGSNSSPPALAIGGSGNRTLAWETADATAAIRIVSLPASGGSWSSATVVSDTSESSLAPSVAIFDASSYVAYEVVPSSGGRLVKVAKTEPGGGIPRTLVRATSRTAPLQVRIHAQSGHLWMDWVDEAGTLGYSEYLNGDWTSVAFQFYETEADLPAARESVGMLVTGE